MLPRLGCSFLLSIALSFFLLPANEAVAIGDPERGEGIARDHGCFECHTPSGELVGDGVPYLTGQKQGYLIRAMTYFRYGEYVYRGERGQSHERVVVRQHWHMSEAAGSLSVRDTRDLAAFYSTQSCNPPALPEAAAFAPTGAEFCEICHGGARSNPWSEMPYLSGQDVDYLRMQVGALMAPISEGQADASRHNRLAEAMFRGYTEADLEEIIRYYASLPCPR